MGCASQLPSSFNTPCRNTPWERQTLFSLRFACAALSSGSLTHQQFCDTSAAPARQAAKELAHRRRRCNRRARIYPARTAKTALTGKALGRTDCIRSHRRQASARGSRIERRATGLGSRALHSRPARVAARGPLRAARPHEAAPRYGRNTPQGGARRWAATRHRAHRAKRFARAPPALDAMGPCVPQFQSRPWGRASGVGLGRRPLG